MITDIELAAMQATQGSALASACHIVRRSVTSDGSGGTTEAETSSSEVICRLSASTNQPDITLVAGAQREGIPWRVTVPAATDVRVSDKITIGARAFEVLAVYGPATWGTARQCVCVER